jgi:hypothetical protein
MTGNQQTTSCITMAMATPPCDLRNHHEVIDFSIEFGFAILDYVPL